MLCLASKLNKIPVLQHMNILPPVVVRTITSILLICLKPLFSNDTHILIIKCKLCTVSFLKSFLTIRVVFGTYHALQMSKIDNFQQVSIIQFINKSELPYWDLLQPDCIVIPWFFKNNVPSDMPRIIGFQQYIYSM